MPMTIMRWTPSVAPTRHELFLLKRLDRVRKLLGFLRVHRHELFDDAYQEELASMYRTTGAGKDALTPAMMAMAMHRRQLLLKRVVKQVVPMHSKKPQRSEEH